MTYNYVTSAALDTGLALAAIFIFFLVLLPVGSFPAWSVLSPFMSVLNVVLLTWSSAGGEPT